MGLGPQKIHQGVVARTGGVAIFTAAFIAAGLLYKPLILLFFFALIPVFLSGVVEDLTGLVSVKIRFFASLITGYLFCWTTGYQITEIDIDAFRTVLALPVVSFTVTALAVAAMANALNIVDGLNGLAGISAMLMIAAFGALSLELGDQPLQTICFSLFFAILGFLIWNFPFGKIFMGDGGAYFLGALIAGVAVLLPERNDRVSAFFSLLTIIYPLYELIRSLIRRSITNGMHAFEADNRHLHSIVYKNISSRLMISSSMKNSLSALVVLFLPLSCCVWAIKYYSDRSMLILGIFLFILMYEVFMATALLTTKVEGSNLKS